MCDGDVLSIPFPEWEEMLVLLGLESGMTAVDLCGGDERVATALAKLLDGRVHIFDIDPEVLNRIRAETDRTGAAVRGWIWDDVLNLPRVLPEAVDFVLMMNTLHGVSDKRGLSEAVWSALKPDGKFAIVDWRRIPHEELVAYQRMPGPENRIRLSPDDVNSAIGSAGFELNKRIKFLPYHFGVLFHKIVTEC
jgi:SAM-dependent methyltransferase